MDDKVLATARHAGISQRVPREPLRASPVSAPTTGAADEPIRLELRSFVCDAAAAEHICALLASFGACRVSSLSGEAAARFDDAAVTDPGALHQPPPSAVVLMTGRARLPACCATMRRLHEVWPGVALIVVTDDVDADGLADLLGCGAFDFTELRRSDAEMCTRVRRALGLVDGVSRQGANVADEGADMPLQALKTRLIGNATSFLKVVRRVRAIASSDASVLLMGETGTGKEVCAQAIHYGSARARGPWVAINCAAIPPELLEVELFGHVRGAYTHAVDMRHGLVHEAESGTLFLDEVDSMPMAAQAKLLRFLQDKEYRIVGSSQLRSANVRVVAASNCDLRMAATHGRFRQDLFFRLNVLTLTLPPLRERREDIAMLALHFLGEANREASRHLVGITPAAMRCLKSHPWPGNVRELKHAMQRAVLLAEGQAIQACDIELDGAAATGEEAISFRDAKARAVEVFERNYLEQLLVQNDGNISRAARSAQKNRRAFFELLRRHAIDANRYRSRVI